MTSVRKYMCIRLQMRKHAREAYTGRTNTALVQAPPERLLTAVPALQASQVQCPQKFSF